MPNVHLPPRTPRVTARAGFSVVEVLVALVIVTVGLIGIAAASAISVHGANVALRERSAVAQALARLSALSAAGCAGATSGSVEKANGLAEQWSVSSSPAGVELTEARVEWDDGRVRRAVVLRSATLC